MTSKVSKSGSAPALNSVHSSLASQPINQMKGFDVTKIDTLDPKIIEALIAANDLSSLGPQQKAMFIRMLCESLGLNPLSQPLRIMAFKDPEADDNAPKKLSVYATKDCAEQLRKIHGVSVTKLDREILEDMVIYTAYVKDREGREDVSTGAVSLMTAGKKAWQSQPAIAPAPLSPTARANAIMKAETKSKRRATLSICGLGFLDETELETLKDVEIIEVPDLPFDNEKPADQQQPKTDATPVKEAAEGVDSFAFANCIVALEKCTTRKDLNDLVEMYLPTLTSEQIKQSIRNAANKQLEVIRRARVSADTDAAAKTGGLFQKNQS